MLAMVGACGFALAANRASGGVYCDADGVFVGHVPLLKRANATAPWSVRALRELNDELSVHYRLPAGESIGGGAEEDLFGVSCRLRFRDTCLAVKHSEFLSREMVRSFCRVVMMVRQNQYRSERLGSIHIFARMWRAMQLP